MSPEQFHSELAAGGFAPPVVVAREIGYALADPDHDFDAFALITEGEITLTVASVATRYGVGDVFRLPAGTSHLESAGPQGVRYFSARRDPNDRP